MKKLMMLVPFALLPMSSETLSQTLPTDAELHTAYCIPVLQNDVGMARSSLDSLQRNSGDPLMEKSLQAARETLAKVQSTLNRLQPYLVPRVDRLDAIALMGASKRAQSDIAEVQQCVRNCEPPGFTQSPQSNETVQKYLHCTESCSDRLSDVRERLSACLNPTWLPF